MSIEDAISIDNYVIQIDYPNNLKHNSDKILNVLSEFGKTK